jgi:hypothetical protein
MRRFLCWAFSMAAVVYTGWMTAQVLRTLPDPSYTGDNDFQGWLVTTAMLLIVFWLAPVIVLSLLAWLVRPGGRETIVYLEQAEGRDGVWLEDSALRRTPPRKSADVVPINRAKQRRRGDRRQPHFQIKNWP